MISGHVNPTDPRFTGRWGKSSRSDGNNACVEFQHSEQHGLVGVCDSKAGENGSVLAFSESAFSEFLDALRSGRIRQP
ncbi:hypothetical protein GCM10027280_46140 [Micromonospora polyrhachis]|uniref:DUF397 domain-containing protein n=1 Tax=Micromonospora polyrhachis TaxID=1282883 RepID=A0A7W7WPX7_9ACTN|nr:hypothetical protein [Micromonospora polyrhachis]